MVGENARAPRAIRAVNLGDELLDRQIRQTKPFGTSATSSGDTFFKP